MFQSIKRLTKHSAVYGLSNIISRFIGFLLLPIHTNYLAPDQLGIAALMFSSIALLNVLFSYGMDVAFMRFFVLADQREEKQKIFSTAYLMILTTGLCFALTMLNLPKPFSNLIFRSPEFTTLVQLGSGILIADALSLLPFLVLRGHEKSFQFGFLKLLNVIANVSLNVLFVIVLKKGVVGIFLANLLASGFTLLTVSYIVVQWLRPKFSRSMLKELLFFGLPYIPSMWAVLIMDQIGRFFLDRMIGKDATGIFSANYKLGMVMSIVVAAFRFAWHPFFLSTVKTEKNAPDIFARILTYFCLITGFIFLTVSLFLEEIVTFRIGSFTLIGKEYLPGLPIVPVILLAYLICGVYVNFIIGIYVKKKTIYLPWITGLGALVCLLSNYLLIPVLGIMGSALATLFAYLAMAGSLYIISQKLYPVNYEFGRILKLVLVYGILFVLGMVVVKEVSIFYRIILVLSPLPLFWVIKFFHPDEKAFILRFLRKS
jgi:O-antigen/teichoic acid export membrane protein